MTRKEIKEWFEHRGYIIEYNAVNPITLKSKAFAVAKPNSGAVSFFTHVFVNIAEIANYINQVNKVESWT